MAKIVRGKPDSAVKKIKRVLDLYEREHPGARAEVYRQNTASVRIRIIDQRFARMSKAQRHDEVFDFIANALDEDTLQEVSVLLLLAPSEQRNSLMNLEFDDPIPSSF